MGYFVSILLFFPLLSPPIPQNGWIQWAFEFPNKVTCELFANQERETIEELIRKQIGNRPHEIKDVQCMTVDEVVDANTQLGHTPQWKTTPKKKPNQPMI
jgi:hypothetical protein